VRHAEHGVHPEIPVNWIFQSQRLLAKQKHEWQEEWNAAQYDKQNLEQPGAAD
jgi:hypothetical protein